MYSLSMYGMNITGSLYYALEQQKKDCNSMAGVGITALDGLAGEA